MKAVSEIGSDLAINAFAVNFRFKNSVGQWVINQDIAEANNLRKCIFKCLSILKVTDIIPNMPLILTLTQLTQDGHKTCLTNFERHLPLDSTFKLRSAFKSLLETLASYSEAGTLHGMAFCPILQSIDEAHILFEPRKMDGQSGHTLFPQLGNLNAIAAKEIASIT
jgi:hypothetical protein